MARVLTSLLRNELDELVIVHHTALSNKPGWLTIASDLVNPANGEVVHEDREGSWHNVSVREVVEAHQLDEFIDQAIRAHAACTPKRQGAAITAYSASGADDEMHFGLSARLFLASQPIFVLKIDVEAYEPTVFEGAQRLMDRNPVRASRRRASAVVSSQP